MTFQKESDFEEALIKILTTKGWESTILKYPTEQDLIRNWANILFDNNRGIDRLGDYPLTDGEMQQIVEQIRELRTPLKLNGFIKSLRTSSATLTVALYVYASEQGKIDVAFAIALILMVLTLIINFAAGFAGKHLKR